MHCSVRPRSIIDQFGTLSSSQFHIARRILQRTLSNALQILPGEADGELNGMVCRWQSGDGGFAQIIR